MQQLANNVQEIKEAYISEIKRILNSIPDSYIWSAIQKAHKESYYRDNGIDYFIENHLVKKFYLPLAVVLDATNSQFPKYKDRQILVKISRENGEGDWKFEATLDGMGKKSLETLINYASAMIPYADRNSQIETILNKFTEKFTIGTFVKGKGNDIYIVSGTPTVVDQSRLGSGRECIFIKGQLLNRYGVVDRYERSLDPYTLSTMTTVEVVEVVTNNFKKEVATHERAIKSHQNAIAKSAKDLETAIDFIKAKKN